MCSPTSLPHPPSWCRNIKLIAVQVLIKQIESRAAWSPVTPWHKGHIQPSARDATELMKRFYFQAEDYFCLNTIRGESWDTKLCLRGPPTNKQTSWHPCRFATATKREEGKEGAALRKQHLLPISHRGGGGGRWESHNNNKGEPRRGRAGRGEARSEPRAWRAGNEEGSGGRGVVKGRMRHRSYWRRLISAVWNETHSSGMEPSAWLPAAGAWRRACYRSQWRVFFFGPFLPHSETPTVATEQ